MTGKEQFQKLSETMRFITKDDEWYRLIYFDVESNTCRYKQIGRSKKANGENTMSYEDACGLYNIEIIENPPLPDQYFFKKIQEPDNNTKRTVSDKTLINYLKLHKEECTEVIDKLKEIVQTHEDYPTRKAAYTTLETLQIDGYEELKQYTCMDKATKKSKRLEVRKSKISALNNEKAVLVYMALVRQYKDDRASIKYGVFSKKWDEMFESDANIQGRDTKLSAFAIMKSDFDDKSYDEIKAYRDTLILYEGYEVPDKIKKLASEKDVIVSLSNNREEYLSGFDMMVKDGRTYRIIDVPYGLSEEKVMSKLRKMPTREQLKEKEQHLKNMLLNKNSPSNAQKVTVVNRYKEPYATSEFRQFMIDFTIHECNSKQLTLACVNLCHRVGIKRDSDKANGGYILYKYCEGSGKRKKNLKRIRKIRKNNAKNRKG